MTNIPIFLIGGAPTSGKSTLARKLSKHFNIPWISTDQIREVMKFVARREDYPDLFTPEGYDAERFLTEFSAEQIAMDERQQADAVWPGIKAFIEEETWTEGYIIEGVDIIPALVMQDYANNSNVKSVFLIDEDGDRIRDVIFTRGLWDDAHTYPDSVKEKEVEWVLKFSHNLKAEAEKYGLPTIEVSKGDNDLAKVLEALK